MTDRMPFGRYRGLQLSDVTTDYLAWLLTRALREPLRCAVAHELERRRHGRGPRQEQAHTPPRGRLPDAGIVEALIRAGLRALAKRHHPDAGGRHEDMIRVNAAAEWLQAQTRSLTC